MGYNMRLQRYCYGSRYGSLSNSRVLDCQPDLSTASICPRLVPRLSGCLSTSDKPEVVSLSTFADHSGAETATGTSSDVAREVNKRPRPGPALLDSLIFPARSLRVTADIERDFGCGHRSVCLSPRYLLASWVRRVVRLREEDGDPRQGTPAEGSTRVLPPFSDCL